MKTIIRGAVASLLLVGLVGCGGSSGGEADSKPDAMTVKGSLALYFWDAPSTNALRPATGTECYGASGYEDIEPGAQITVRDEAGKTVGIGELEGGKYRRATYTCDFTFKVTDVTAGGRFYTIAIGDRKPFNFKADEASSLKLQLGT